MGAPNNLRSERALRSALADQQRKVDGLENDDVIIDAARRLLLRSPGGDFFKIVVNDAGELSTVNMGPKL